MPSLSVIVVFILAIFAIVLHFIRELLQNPLDFQKIRGGILAAVLLVNIGIFAAVSNGKLLVYGFPALHVVALLSLYMIEYMMIWPVYSQILSIAKKSSWIRGTVFVFGCVPFIGLCLAAAFLFPLKPRVAIGLQVAGSCLLYILPLFHIFEFISVTSEKRKNREEDSYKKLSLMKLARLIFWNTFFLYPLLLFLITLLLKRSGEWFFLGQLIIAFILAALRVIRKALYGPERRGRRSTNAILDGAESECRGSVAGSTSRGWSGGNLGLPLEASSAVTPGESF